MRRLIFRISISVIVVGFIVWQVGGLDKIAEVLVGLNPAYVPLILLVSTLDRSLMTFKWAWLLRGRGVHLSFFLGMKIYCASMVWGMFLPATVGADMIRAYSTSRTGLDSNEVVASIVIERMVGFLSALLFGLFSLILLSRIVSLGTWFDLVWWLGIATLVGAVIVFSASFSQGAFDFLYGHLLYPFRDTRIMRRMQQFHLTYRAYRDNKGNLAAFFGMTLCEQLIPILEAWLSALALGVKISPLFIAGAVPLAFLISRVPISIEVLGVYEGIFILLMSLFGVSPSQAIAITLVWGMVQIASWLPWWMAYVIDSGGLRPPQIWVRGS